MSTGQFDLIKCGICGKAFVKYTGGRPTCPDCYAEEEALYRRVRGVLTTYPERRMGIGDVAEMIGVEERKISYLVDIGMFKLTSGLGELSWEDDDSRYDAKKRL
ncbi:MAG: hypothetical protein LBT31_04095 [Synergistaceae bacterium]|jgi:hypothetical protein|nr:hypothetical protein [Synergistaceae bacterium]